LNKVHI